MKKGMNYAFPLHSQAILTKLSLAQKNDEKWWGGSVVSILSVEALSA